jgi:hypothetical protein
MTPCSLTDATVLVHLVACVIKLKMKAASYSETLVAIYLNTRRHELYNIHLRKFHFFLRAS